MRLSQAELQRRKPPFDSLAVNSYQAGEGIRPHVDLLRYQDGIAIVSLLSAANMEFAPAGKKAMNATRQLLPDEGPVVCATQLIRLEPGDVLTLQGDARYSWTHGIASVETDMWQGRMIPRQQRISLTFRALTSGGELCKQR